MYKKNSAAVSFIFMFFLGVVFAFLNLGLHYLNSFFSIPLYMDTLFTVTAAFFSLASGIVCALVFHLVCTLVYDFPLYSMAWSVCSLTVVFIIRFYLAKRDENSLFDILAIFFIIVLVVSFEGAVIFTILEASANYADDSQVRFMYTLLRSFKIPVFLSALLPRFPVNLVDKAICVPLGFLCYKGLDRIFRRKNAAA